MIQSNAVPEPPGAPAPPLDFSALSAEWRILSTSPAWPGSISSSLTVASCC